MLYLDLIEEDFFNCFDELFRRLGAAMRPFQEDLDAFFGELFASDLPGSFPPDWRRRWHQFVADQALNRFYVQPESIEGIEIWIEEWARECGLLVDDPPTEAGSTKGGHGITPVHVSPYAKMVDPSEADLRAARYLKESVTGGAPPTVLSQNTIKDIWGNYDDAVRQGYDPWIWTRAAVTLARTAFPSSDRPTIYKMSDGSTYIDLGGGPTSGDMAGQAILFLGVAKGAGVARTVAEELLDNIAQDATGLPVGPSALKGKGSPSPNTASKIPEGHGVAAQTPKKPSAPIGEKTPLKGGNARAVETAIPQKALDTLDAVKKTGAAPKGYQGGRLFSNDGRGGGQILSKVASDGTVITYREFDVNPYTKGVNRGQERIVIGSDGKSYYTNDHYFTFTEIQ